MRFLASEWGLQPEPYSTFEITVSVFRHLRPRRIVQPALNYSLYERVNLNPFFWPNPADAVDHIAEKAPQILHGMPSSLEQLADLVLDAGRSGFVRPRLILTMAETLLPATRRRLESVFQAPVCDTYGLVEVGGIVAEECRDRKGLHVNVVDYLVEIVGQDGKPAPEGSEGEIVITNLYHTAIPVLRYRTGDFGVLERTPCSCGRLEPRIVRLAGRALTRFIRPDGREYNPFDVFGEFLLTLPAAQFRMIQDGRFDIILQYRSSDSLEEHESMKGIRKAAEAVLCPGARFRVQRVESFGQSGKFQAFLRLENHEPL
jgi:phenylacetate-coenzyme A ligase PaaK-like adenylate-forming protein